VATSTRTAAWPTLDRVGKTLSALKEAANELEELGLDCYGLLDEADPYSPRDGVPVPTAADLAALTVLVEEYSDQLQTVDGFLDQFRSLRNAAAYQVARY